MLEALTVYLLHAMVTWIPLDRQPEAPWVAVARYESIARDIARVCLRDDEPPMFKGTDGIARSALVLTSVGTFESGLAKEVELRCLEDPGRCWFYSLWQMNPEEGVILDGPLFVYGRHKDAAWLASHADEVIHGPALARSRPLAARVALHIIRFSISRSGTLGSYTGEGGNGPKARSRLDSALWFAHKHPFNPDSPPLQGLELSSLLMAQMARLMAVSSNVVRWVDVTAAPRYE
jgi:hypothetical protein